MQESYALCKSMQGSCTLLGHVLCNGPGYCEKTCRGSSRQHSHPYKTALQQQVYTTVHRDTQNNTRDHSRQNFTWVNQVLSPMHTALYIVITPVIQNDTSIQTCTVRSTCERCLSVGYTHSQLYNTHTCIGLACKARCMQNGPRHYMTTVNTLTQSHRTLYPDMRVHVHLCTWRFLDKFVLMHTSVLLQKHKCIHEWHKYLHTCLPGIYESENTSVYTKHTRCTTIHTFVQT